MGGWMDGYVYAFYWVVLSFSVKPPGVAVALVQQISDWKKEDQPHSGVWHTGGKHSVSALW